MFSIIDNIPHELNRYAVIGAGIFVFPGLAAGRAGPAATLSFAIGAVTSLLVALPTAELATVSALVGPTDASLTLVYATAGDETEESEEEESGEYVRQERRHASAVRSMTILKMNRLVFRTLQGNSTSR